MKPSALLLFLTLTLLSCTSKKSDIESSVINESLSPSPTIVIHGGAGYMTPASIDPEMEARYLEALTRTVNHGYELLEKGIQGKQVVEAVIRRLESDSLFNAGLGAVVTASGQVELDASIMEGKELQAGAVCRVRHVEHPISLALRVLDSSQHVLLSGDGADQFAQSQGFEWIENSFFITQGRTRQYQERLAEKFGTVGVAVLDADGNLAAGTSTGGMMMKEFGRVGDSPIIGAGTYADNNGCAVSCTGHGEFFIRYSVAHSLSSKVESGIPVQEAADQIIQKTLLNVEGMGGLVAVDAQGNIAMSFNTPGMFRAFRNGQEMKVGIYKE